jgi:hypothetical protein
VKLLWACRWAMGMLIAALAACSSGSHQEVKLDMTALKADLQAIARARILFAHQSVGRDLLAGVQELAREAAVPLHIRRIDGVAQEPGPGLFHTEVGRNGDPDSKVEAFAGLLTGPERPAYDLALLKFCYEDVHQGAKQAGLLQRYEARMDAVQSARPDVRLLHVSVPLRADPPGWKTTLKRWLGRETWEDADNARRNDYNDELRLRFGGGRLFDLAMIESTLPDGTRSGFTLGGKTVYTLAQAYTRDGGHLNELGRRQAAAAFVHALARALTAGASLTR